MRWKTRQEKDRRRALKPPENLEPRIAPGVLLYGAPGAELVAGSALDNGVVASWSSGGSAQHEILVTSKSSAKPKPVKADATDSAIALLMSNQVGGQHAQQSGMFTATARSGAVAPPPPAMVVAVGSNVSVPVAEKLKTPLPTVKSAVAARPIQTQDPVLRHVAPPVVSKTPPASPGGGGSNAQGGGSAGNLKAAPKPAATPTAKPVATPAPTTFVAAKVTTPVPAPAVNNTSPPPAPVTTAKSGPPTQQNSTPAATLAVSARPIGGKSASTLTKYVPPQTPTLGTLSTLPSPVAQAIVPAPPLNQAIFPQLSAEEVKHLLDRASAATPRTDAIIAVVDRNGTILGVRVEQNVIPTGDQLVFAIDGAVAKARTAAFFSNDEAPLTSRTVRFISQTTITQREVESNPNIPDLNSTVRGPGFVAPIGLGGHFPPGVMFTPQVDLFAIEHTNRDSVDHVGPNLIRDGIAPGTDDILLGKDFDPLGTRFGAEFADGKNIPAPESYGKVSGKLIKAQSRGIGTLPGGVPLFRLNPASPSGVSLVGGIGVFFPGPDGYATFEQNFQAGVNQSTDARLNAPLVLEAEYTAVVAANNGVVGNFAPLERVKLPEGRIDLVGIQLEIYGPHPNGLPGLLAFGKRLGFGPSNGANQQVTTNASEVALSGKPVPDGWLVEPKDAPDGSLTKAEVREIIERGINEAELTRAAIRLPLGTRTKMMLSVSDKDGNILGLYRMPDATFFSIDVSVAKSRNVAYYADAQDLQSIDQVPGVDAGVAFTNRTFRYLSTPFFPFGVDTAPSGPFSTLNDPGINPKNGENKGPVQPANAYNSVLGFDAFNPGTNFREHLDPGANIGNQNGVVFFPGSTPLYKNGVLVGGFGVSGDGVDQDDVVTFGGGGQFIPVPSTGITRADQVFFRGVRLTYQKFNRNPRG